ncbi:TPA: hypothetical protein DCZ32_02780 [Candidatus Uhrbacteria bacterium]|nr:hypothetical protein [Candidatus Uhrbacteria bacterium]
MDEEEIGWYKKFNVPPGQYSPRIRMWHNAAWYTAFQWWWNKHAETGQPVLTYVHPATGLRVLPDKEWFGKDFSSINHEYTCEKSFFDIFRELELKIPFSAGRNSVEPANSVATVSMGDTNSYFVSGCVSKNCFYCLDCQNAEFCVDCNAGVDITDCWKVHHSVRMFNCKFAIESQDCMNSSFLFDCRNCENCFGATNKRNRKYIWFNEQISKEEYEKRIADARTGKYSMLRQYEARFIQMMQDAKWPENFNRNSTNCIGDYLIKCANAKFCFYGLDSTDGYYCYGFYRAKDCAFCCAVPGEHCYQSWTRTAYNCKFSQSVFSCDDVEYCLNCYNCSHCFGCVGLQKKKYCIFNRQYEEQDYWQKLDALKCEMLDSGEYGRPFPIKYSFSYFPESGCSLYFGAELSDWNKIGAMKFDASAEGAYGEQRIEGKTVASSDELPDDIRDSAVDGWVGKLVLDKEINRPLTYLKQEVEFYRKHDLPLPRQHLTARIRDLARMMNIGTIETVECAECGKAVNVAVNRSFQKRNILCNACYLKFIEQNG